MFGEKNNNDNDNTIYLLNTFYVLVIVLTSPVFSPLLLCVIPAQAKKYQINCTRMHGAFWENSAFKMYVFYWNWWYKFIIFKICTILGAMSLRELSISHKLPETGDSSAPSIITVLNKPWLQIIAMLLLL